MAKLTLKGFDDYISKLRKADASVQKVSEKILLDSARMYHGELISQVNASPMSQETKDAMMDDIIEPWIRYSSDYIVVAETGFRIGKLNPKNLSGGYIALFNEYGTGKRKTRNGKNRGSLEEMEFTRRAHKIVDPRIRKTQKKMLEEALKEALG